MKIMQCMTFVLFVLLFAGCKDTDSQNAVYLYSIDEYGKTEWRKSLDKNSRPEAIRLTKDGGFYVAGKTADTELKDLDLYLALYDDSAESQWIKTFDFEDGDEARCIDVTADGGCILGGRSRMTDEFLDWQYTRMLLLNTDIDGNENWHMAEKVDGNNWATRKVSAFEDGSMLAIVDECLSFYEVMSSHIYKLSADGTKQWSIDGIDFLLPLTSIRQIRQDNQGNFCLLTGTSDYSFLAKINIDGDIIDNEKYLTDNTDELNAFFFPVKNMCAYDFVVLEDGGVVMAGCSNEQYTFNIVQKNAANEVVWEDSFEHEEIRHLIPLVQRVKILALDYGIAVLVEYVHQDYEEEIVHEHLVMYSVTGSKLWTLEDEDLRYADIEVAENGSILLLAETR